MNKNKVPHALIESVATNEQKVKQSEHQQKLVDKTKEKPTAKANHNTKEKPTGKTDKKLAESNIVNLDEKAALVEESRRRFTAKFNDLGFIHSFSGGVEAMVTMKPMATNSLSRTKKAPKEVVTFSPAAFRARYGHLSTAPMVIDKEKNKIKYGKPAEIWSTSWGRNMTDGFRFDPEDEPLSIDEKLFFNLYQGRFVEPAAVSLEASSAVISPWLNHLKTYVCCNDEKNFQTLIKQIAIKYQQPWLKTFATIITGIEGTGKEVVFDPIQQLYGLEAHGKLVQKVSDVIGENNQLALSGCLFLVLDEVFAGTKDATDGMKTIVFGKTQSLANKYIKKWKERNLAQVFMFANREQVIYFSTHDRRYFCLDMDPNIAEDTPENKKYFENVWDAIMRPEFLPHLANFLLKTDTEGFNFRRPPATKKLAEQKLATAEPEEKFLFEIIRNGYINPLMRDDMASGEKMIEQWPKKMSTTALVQYFDNWIRHKGIKFLGDKTVALTRQLTRFGFKRGKVIVDGKQVRGWAFPSVDEAKGAMNKILGFDIDGNDDDEYSADLGEE